MNKLDTSCFSFKSTSVQDTSILVVDDDLVFQKLLKVFLENKGYQVGTASNAETGLAYLEKNQVDLVILDHSMPPGMSGLEMLQLLHSQENAMDFTKKTTAVVMLTGTDDQDLAIDAMKLGALDYIRKNMGDQFLSKLEKSIKRALHVNALENKMRTTHLALRESEKRYRQLFFGCKAVLLIVDPNDGRIIDANKAACRFYGYSLSEILALKIVDINVLKPNEIEVEMAQAALEKRNHFFFIHQLKDGSLRDVEVHSGPIDIEGQTCLYSIVHDISQRRETERFVAGQNRTLEKLAKLEPLEDVLNELTNTMEKQSSDAHYAIFSVDPKGGYKLESAPKLPQNFVDLARIEGLPDQCVIMVGGCEDVAFRENSLNVACDGCETRKWMDKHSITGAQIEPILSSKKIIIGVLCAFHLKDLDANDKRISQNLLKTNAPLAGVTLEHHKAVKAIEDQAQLLQTIIDAVPVPIYYKGTDGRYIGCNDAMAEFYEQKHENLVGRTLGDFYPEDEIKIFQECDSELLKNGGMKIIEGTVSRSDGPHHVLAHKAQFLDPEGDACVVGAVIDITERKIYEDELRLASTVFETTSEAIVVTDTKNCIQAVNPSFTHVTGYSEEEVIGRDPSFLSSGRQDGTFYQRMWVQLCKTGRWQGEIWNRRKNGDLYAEWLAISAVHNNAGEISQYVAVFSDITKRKKAEELIIQQANFDTLTNLPNRNLFLDRLGRAMVRAKRNRNLVALMFIDLDRFKWVNDTLGHNIGDLLLQEAAARLMECVRETDTVARLGGDEFTIVLPDLKHDRDIEKLAQKILECLAEPFHISGHEVFVSGSIGITIFPQDGLELEDLLRNADTAMYRAKEGGRNAYRFFTSQMNEDTQKQMMLERDLRHAIERNEFIVHYQPVVDVSSGDVISAEALVRWQHPEKGLMAPGFFIGVAEETGLITQIGNIVLKQVCQQIKIWQSDPILKDIRIAVNLSPRQLHNKNVVTDLEKLISDSGISAHSLALEITETLVMQDPEGAAELLEDIRAMGIKVYLDDFGTGYSSLNYLKRFSFDVLKIDRSFIMDVEFDKGDAALVEAIIVMAHKLGIKVVAEGVENKNQLDFVASQDCDMIQGYYYSKPLESQDFFSYCRRTSAEP